MNRKILTSLFFGFLFSLLTNAQNINDDLLLRYLFDGDYTDASSNNYHGDANGCELTSDRFGNPESAASFNGINGYLNFPNVSELKPPLPVSFSFWIRYDSDDYMDRTVFNTSYEEDRNSGVFFTSKASSNQYAVGFGNGSNFYTASSIESYTSNHIIETGVWTNIAVVVESAGQMQIYINCTVSEGTYAGNGFMLVYSDLQGCIGRHDQNIGQPGFYLKGAIDDFRYWSRALSPEEITTICNTPNCPGWISDVNNYGCAGSDVTYTFNINSDVSAIDNILWTFNETTTSSELSPTEIYYTAGTFPFSLEVTMDNGCIYTTQGVTTVLANPEEPILPESITICEGENYILDFSSFSDWDEILGPDNNQIFSEYAINEPGNYQFTFNDMCASTSLTLSVSETQTSGYLVYPDSNAICLGSVTSVYNSAWDGSANAPFFTIEFGDDSESMLIEDSVQHTYSQAGQYTLTLSGAVSSCTIFETIQISVEEVISMPQDTAIQICEGEPYIFDFDELDSVIHDGELLPPETLGASVAGLYSLYAYNSCGVDSQKIEIDVVPFSPAPGAQSETLCPDRDTLTMGFTNPNFVFTWATGDTTPTIEVTVGDIYSVAVMDSTGFCSASYSFVVSENIPITDPIFNASYVQFCEEGVRNLIPNDLGFDYTFSDGSTGSLLEVGSSGPVIATFFDGCFTYSDAIDVDIVDCICPVSIPSIFTPNGDGKNDRFKLNYACETQVKTVKIFSRWGLVVYNRSYSELDWDGDVEKTGEAAKDGVYFYVLQYTQKLDGIDQSTELMGTITLAR